MTLTEARKITHLIVNIDRGATSDADLLDALHVEFPWFDWDADVPRGRAGDRPTHREADRVLSSPGLLDEIVRLWLADERPAWETVEAFERRVFYFEAYVRVEAASQDAAWGRVCSESVYVSEADASDPEHEGDVNLVVTDLLDSEELDTGPECVCPPEVRARGGFKSWCPVHG